MLNVNTPTIISPTNFEYLKCTFEWMTITELSHAEYKVLMYISNQQFNFIKNGQTKDGDFVGYAFLATKIHLSMRQTIRAVNTLVSRHILIKSSGNHFGNHYSVNTHYLEWQRMWD